ncbi:filamin-A-like [Eurosta solidaginis]|uniref:filamin-A-like n=1 Tax=Eurosta solidaginis TaxID=178769 RepID=UPI003530B170
MSVACRVHKFLSVVPVPYINQILLLSITLAVAWKILRSMLKVHAYSPGIEHGVLATFQSRFICDTRGAVAGQLTVHIRGPKGAFRVEMQRESQKDRTILCKYVPTEPGDYRFEVKWAGEFVPGSPFPEMIFDTEEELLRYLQGL